MDSGNNKILGKFPDFVSKNPSNLGGIFSLGCIFFVGYFFYDFSIFSVNGIIPTKFKCEDNSYFCDCSVFQGLYFYSEWFV